MSRLGRTALGAAAVAALAMAAAGCHEHRHVHAGRGAAADASASGASSSGASESGASLAAAASQPSDAADTGDAKAFLDSLYAHDRSGLQMFGADETAVFDSKTLALLRKDKSLLNGRPSALKGDWLCDCANPGSQPADIAVQSANPAVGAATADLGATHVGLDLTKLHGMWRIHDIRLSQGRRLRKVLIQEVKRLKGAALGGTAATTSEDGE